MASSSMLNGEVCPTYGVLSIADALDPHIKYLCWQHAQHTFVSYDTKKFLDRFVDDPWQPVRWPLMW